MALRLPDIPIESWIADQQDRLQRLTESAFPSLEFRAAALDAESKIPAYGAETDMALAEQQALAEEEERRRQQQQAEQQRAAEEQRRQQEALAQQQAAQQQAQAEADHQKSLMDQAWGMARDLGIPTPGDVYDYFTGSTSRPVNVGDHESSAGAFDPTGDTTPAFPESQTQQAVALPYADPSQVQSSGDFLAQTQSLNDSVFGPPDTAAPVNGPALPPSDTPVYDTLMDIRDRGLEAGRSLSRTLPAASAAWDLGEGAYNAVTEAANALSDPYMRTNVGVAKGVEKTWNEADRQSITESLTETPEQTKAREESLIPGNPALSRALHLAKDLGEDMLESKAITDITGQIWKENNLPLVFWGQDGPYVGKERRSSDDIEINPGEFFAPDRVGFGGANVPGMVRQGAGRVAYGQGTAGAIERGVVRGAQAVGSRLGQGIKAIGGEIQDAAGAVGRGLREADRALGSIFTDDTPDVAANIGARRLPSTRQVEGRPRMFHGTGEGFGAPDPTRFDEDGLFGPGYYLTSDPRVAADYANQGPSGNIRPVDLDASMTFFHADEPVPQEDVQRIANVLRRRYGDDPQYTDTLRDYLYISQIRPEDYRSLMAHQDTPLQGERFYNNLGRDFLPDSEMENRFSIDLVGDSEGDIKPDKKFVNDILSEAGFDGVYYRGGSRIPITDESGRTITHDAVAVFPNKLDKIRNALSGEARGINPRERPAPTMYEVFDAKNGDVVQIFDSETDAARFAERTTAETGVLHDYGAAAPTADFEGDVPTWMQAERNTQTSKAAEFGELARGMLPTHSAAGAGVGTVGGGTAGAAAGWNSAPEDAPLTEKLDRATQGFMAGAILGGTTGAGAAAAASWGGTRIVERAMRNGTISFETMLSHPNFESRMKAIMLMAARGLPDDAVVPIPPAGTYRISQEKGDVMDAALRRMGLGRLNRDTWQVELNDLTAGQIRSRYSQTPIQELGKAANDLIVDALSGVGLRHGRGRELRADIPSVTGEFPRRPNLTGQEGVNQFGLVELDDGITGYEIRPYLFEGGVIPEDVAYVDNIVKETARKFGVPEPRVYLGNTDQVNAWAFRRSGARPAIAISQGLVDGDFTDEEISAIIAHELAHATDADLGRSLIEPMEDFVSKIKTKVERAIDRTPDDMGDMPDEFYDNIPDDLSEDYGIGGRGYADDTADAEYELQRDWNDATFDESGHISEDTPYYYNPDINASEPTKNPPRRGPWRERLDTGLQIPKGARPGQAREIERAFNEAERLIMKAQGVKGAKNQMRFHRMAEEAWAKYEGLREKAGASLAPSTRTGVARAVPDDATPFGTGDDAAALARPEPESRPGVGTGPADQGIDRPVGTPESGARVDEAPNFEPEPLPDVLDYKQQYSRDEVATLIKQLREEASADSRALSWIDQDTAKIMPLDKITGRHIEQLVNHIGQVRKIPNRQTAEEWGDAFLRKNGWLAPLDSRMGENASNLAGRGTRAVSGEADAVAPRRPSFDERLATAADTDFLDRLKPNTRVLTSHFFGSDAAWDDRTLNSAIEAARRAGHTVEKVPYEDGYMGLMYRGPVTEGGTTRGVQNLQGGAAGAALGAVDPDQEDDEYETPIDRMAAGAILGIVGRRKILPSLQKGAAHPLAGSARKAAFVNPTPTKVPDAGPFERLWSGITSRMTDDLGRLQQYQKDLSREWEKQMGSKLPGSVLAAELKRLDPTRAAEMVVDERLKPHLKTFTRLGIPDEDINTYIANVHDIDIANKTGNPGRTFPGGSSVADALRDNQNFIAALKKDLSPAEFQEFQQALDGFWSMGDYVLQMKRDAGLITDEAYKALRADYPHYVPTRILDYINDDTAVGFGKSLSVNSSTIHEIGQQGTDKDALMPIPAMIGAVYEAQVAAQKNTVFQAFLGMAAHANRLPTSVSGAALTERSEQRMRELMNAVTPVGISEKIPNDKVAVQGFIDGTKYRFAVDKSLGDVVKFQAPVTIPILSGLMHAFRAGATARNPVFLTANLFLDLSSYMVREASRAGGPHKIPEVLGVYAQTLNEFLLQPDAWKWIAAHEYRGDMARFLREGGGSSGQVGRGALRPDPVYWKGIDDLAKTMGFRQQAELEKEAARLTREGPTPLSARTPAEALGMIKDILTLKPVEAVGERIELVPRVAAMRLAERRGATQLESINAGRTTTIDFNKGGSWSRTINQMIPFFNVGMQALADGPRAFQENPKAWSATVVATVMAPMVLAEAWNNSTDQMRQDYQDVPDYIKDQGLVVMMPHGMKIGDFTVPDAPVDAQGNRRPQFFHFRFRQLAPISQMTRRTLQDWVPEWKNDVPEAERRTLYDEIISGVSAISPVGANSPTDLVTSLTPLGVQTAIQLAMDWDSYRGKRIKSKYADERSSPLSHGISELTQSLPEGLQLTPAQAEFASRDIGTGYAGMLHGASQILYGEDAKGGSGTVVQDIPLAGGLASRFVKGSIGGNAESAREATVTKSSEKILQENKIRWRPAEAAPEIDSVPLNRKEYASYQRQVNKVTDEVIRELAADPKWRAMSPVDREVILQREVSRERDKVRRDFLKFDIPKSEQNARIRKLESENKLPSIGVRR